MNVSPALFDNYPGLNDAQRSVVGHGEGPLLVIAGPGSGKTLSLVLRAMNLLLLGKATPQEIVLCTFTEKAAFEIRDRVSAAARKLGYTSDLSELKVSTIHGMCNQLLTTHRHHTPLGNNFETLDELTQLLFIFDNLKEIFGENAQPPYLSKWNSKWTAIEGARGYFDKITEELVDPRRLANSTDPFLQQLATAYQSYHTALFASNRLDFAHQQRLVYDLLQDVEMHEAITRRIRYVMVDEYQDTNFVQEQILFKLTEATKNLCVVGDEDQSLYRFRGATVRNILEFPTQMPNCSSIQLTTNYRSHQQIVHAYDRWMASADWSNPGGVPFRFPKTIQPDPNCNHPNYPAIFSVYSTTPREEAEALAQFIAFLKANEVIADYGLLPNRVKSITRWICNELTVLG